MVRFECVFGDRASTFGVFFALISRPNKLPVGYERSLIKPTGRTLEQEWAHVYTLRDGKIAKFRAFEDTAALVVAFDAG